MAHEYTTWAWRMPGLQPSEKLVLLHLADAANHDGVSWPSIPRMARQTCLGERTIQRALSRLADAGHLQVAKRYRENGSHTSNVYQLPVSVTSDPPRHSDTTPPSPRHHPPRHSGTPRTVSKNRQQNQGLQASPRSSAAPPASPKGDDPQTIQRVVDAYNDHRGQLPKCVTLNSSRRQKIRRAIRDLGTLDEVAAAMAVAAAEVANDPWWQKHRYGFDNLLAAQRFVQKAETAMSRGTTDRHEAEVDRMVRALEGDE